MTIEEFLLARIDEDEEAARDAAGWDLSGSVRAEGQWCREGVNSVIDSSQRLVVYGDGPAPEDMQAEHIIRHDPARVLRECAAKRALIDHASDATGLDMSVDMDRAVGRRDQDVDPYLGDAMLRTIAAVYSDHPDYQQEWAA